MELLREGLVVFLANSIKIGCNSRDVCGNARERFGYVGHRAGVVRAIDVNGMDLNSVLRVGRSGNDRRSTCIEDPYAARNYRFRIEGIGHTESRREIILSFG